jgi:hypothetical protein
MHFFRFRYYARLRCGHDHGGGDFFLPDAQQQDYDLASVMRNTFQILVVSTQAIIYSIGDFW